MPTLRLPSGEFTFELPEALRWPPPSSQPQMQSPQPSTPILHSRTPTPQPRTPTPPHRMPTPPHRMPTPPHRTPTPPPRTPTPPTRTPTPARTQVSTPTLPRTRTPTPTLPFQTSRSTHGQTHPILIIYKSSKANYEGPDRVYHRAQVAIAKVAPYRYVLQVFVGPLVSDNEAYRHIFYDEDIKTHWTMKIEEKNHQVEWGSPVSGFHSLRFLNRKEVWEFSQGFEFASLAIQRIRTDIVSAMDHVHTYLFSVYLQEAGHVMGDLDNIQFKDESNEYKRRHGVVAAASASIDESDMVQCSAFDTPTIDKLPPLVVGAEGFDETNTLQRSLYPVVVRLEFSANALGDEPALV